MQTLTYAPTLTLKFPAYADSRTEAQRVFQDLLEQGFSLTQVVDFTTQLLSVLEEKMDVAEALCS